MTCRGCGVELAPGQEQASVAIDPSLQATLKDVRRNGGICPVCGRLKEVLYWRRRRFWYNLAKACFLIAVARRASFGSSPAVMALDVSE